MNSSDLERVRELGRRRGEELQATGLLERKQGALRALGWPDAVRQVRERKRAS